MRVLAPNVTREEAIAILGGGVAGRVRRLASGPLRSIADVYLPFSVFRTPAGCLGIDAVNGTLDLYSFDRVVATPFVTVDGSRNCVPAALTHAEAARMLADRIERLHYQRFGFVSRPRRRARLEATNTTMYVPYWVGFFGRGEIASLAVVDAIRRQVEGGRVRRAITDWLTRPLS